MYRRPTLVFYLVATLLVFGGGYLVGTHGSMLHLPGVSADNQAPSNASAGEGDIAVYFSPQGGCTEAVVKQIDLAQKTIEIQAYSFTSRPIAEALVKAHQRGVKVTAIVDKQANEGYSEAEFLSRAGIPTYLDAAHTIAHNKIVLIDDATLITGSFNFTKQAERTNAENLVVIHNHPHLCSEYAENFDKHLDHSKMYDGK